MRGLNQFHNLHDIPIDFEVIRKLPESIKRKQLESNGNYSGKFLTGRYTRRKDIPELLILNPAIPASRLYALAIDVGPPRFAPSCWILIAGVNLAILLFLTNRSAMEQMSLPVSLIPRNPAVWKKLQELVVASINEVIENLLQTSQVSTGKISVISPWPAILPCSKYCWDWTPNISVCLLIFPPPTFFPLVKACTRWESMWRTMFIFIPFLLFPAMSEGILSPV